MASNLNRARVAVTERTLTEELSQRLLPLKDGLDKVGAAGGDVTAGT